MVRVAYPDPAPSAVVGADLLAISDSAGRGRCRVEQHQAGDQARLVDGELQGRAGGGLLGQAGLADPWLAADQHNPALAPARGTDLRGEQRQLGALAR
jgi:hypothetical protein